MEIEDRPPAGVFLMGTRAHSHAHSHTRAREGPCPFARDGGVRAGIGQRFNLNIAGQGLNRPRLESAAQGADLHLGHGQGADFCPHIAMEKMGAQRRHHECPPCLNVP